MSVPENKTADGGSSGAPYSPGATSPPAASPPPPEPHKHGDLGFELPPPATVSRTRIVAIGAVILVCLLIVFAGAYLPRRRARLALEEGVRSAESAAPRVEVVKPSVVTGSRSLSLPGSVQPLEETTLYPRANGYVRRWLVDMGDKVTEGQLLAEIDAPELAREISQARAELTKAKAQLVQAKANRDFSKSVLERYEQLVPAGVASQQDLDQKRGQAKVDEASVAVSEAVIRAEEANLSRLSELQSFTKITAPFAGTVTMRSAQRGALVAPGSATPLFKIAATDPVRVLVAVPQDVAPTVKAGQQAKVQVRELPGQSLDGTIARTSGALDPATRTMTVEVRVANPDDRLLTGMYADVTLSLTVPRRSMEIPATALFNDSRGMRVAVIDAANKLHFVPITVERDTGSTLQIATGLTGEERVVKLANAGLTEGVVVEVIVPAPATSGTASAGPAGSARSP